MWCNSLSPGRSSEEENGGWITQRWQKAEFHQLTSVSHVLWVSFRMKGLRQLFSTKGRSWVFIYKALVQGMSVLTTYSALHAELAILGMNPQFIPCYSPQNELPFLSTPLSKDNLWGCYKGDNNEWSLKQQDTKERSQSRILNEKF